MQRLFLFGLLVVSQLCNAQSFSVYFATDKSIVQQRFSATLDSVVSYSESNTLPVKISCHCDNRADSLYNYNLSLRRANAVKNWLKNKGVSATIEIIGYGESNPHYPNTPNLRYKNRRCDVAVGAGGKPVNNFSEKVISELSEGELVQMDGLEFVGNQAVPNYYSMPVLYHLYKTMQENPGLKIKLLGHVCCSDDLDLSYARARAVVDFLVGNGIDSARLSYQGYSNYRPLVKEIDEATQQQNRRVEILVVENQQTEQLGVKEKKNLLFRVPLRDFRFKPNTNYPMGITRHNLGFLADMISTSEGYLYTLYIYAGNAPLVAKRRNYLESQFRKKRISRKQMRFIPRGKFSADKEDMLILEVTPIE